MLDGLRALAPDYDDYLVDLWGVVHDGRRPFDGVVDALERLAALGGRRVLFLTNTSRLGDDVGRALERMGVARELFFDVVSSGDVTRAALVARDPAIFRGLPAAPRCVHLGDPGYASWLFELGLDVAQGEDALDDAELVLVTGAPADSDALAATRARLAPLAARGVPLLCTNPDRVIPTPTGVVLGPGAVASAYVDAGGRAALFGKPHAPIYDEAKRRLAGGAPPVPEGRPRRVAALGDLLATDVRGARDAGVFAVWVTGTGAHAAEVGDAAARDALYAREGVRPDARLARLAW